MNYSHTARRTLPFLGKCLIFWILCWNLFYFMPFAPPSLTTAEFGILTALTLAFLPVRVTSFAFFASAELACLYLMYDGLYTIFRLFGAGTAFLRFTFHGIPVMVLWGAYLFCGYVNARHIVTTTYKVKTGCPVPGQSLRILQISDVHPGRFGEGRVLRRLENVVKETRPDMMVLTGDIFDEFTRPAGLDAYMEFFRKTKPRYGTWYVFGNHDADWHWRKPDHTREDIRRRFREAGVGVLEDECAVISTENGNIRVAGRRFAEEERMSASALLAGRFDGLTVMLCHEPVELTECADAGADVTFAGHTHGGQIFPLGLLMKHVVKSHEMHEGMREIRPGKVAVVSCGVGTWGYPVRTEGKSEVVVVEVESGENFMKETEMREEYDFSNAVKNPYTQK